MTLVQSTSSNVFSFTRPISRPRCHVARSGRVALRPLLATWQRGLLIGRVKLKTLEDVDWTNVISFTDYLVGGLEHFFHNIWDNPSH
jgi:hypothetical protein